MVAAAAATSVFWVLLDSLAAVACWLYTTDTRKLSCDEVIDCSTVMLLMIHAMWAYLWLLPGGAIWCHE